ncbi:hypothetical protein SDC9_143107 [bioreactor metagenome]|uniref:Uncharacterized protein n=1 Tax=bioreactor metagenome TaxID=1076179 RepID=A0A645E316_9ZZZZ
MDDRIFFRSLADADQCLFDIFRRLRHRRRKITGDPFPVHRRNHPIDALRIAVHVVHTIAAMAVDINEARHQPASGCVNHFLAGFGNILRHIADCTYFFFEPDESVGDDCFPGIDFCMDDHFFHLCFPSLILSLIFTVHLHDLAATSRYSDFFE